MGLFSWIFGKEGPRSGETPGDEHAVMVEFEYGDTDLSALWSVEDELREAIDAARVGEYDGHQIQIDASAGVLYMYGPDGDRLFAVVRPILERSTALRNPVATVRYGPAAEGARSIKVKLRSGA